MQVRSNSFQNDETLPQEFTCQGSGSPPPLEFGDMPDDTKSLVLICDDPDAPKGIFYHWGVYNIPPDTMSFSTGADAGDFPTAKNTSGDDSYHPPCPPQGDQPHRYRFHLYALDVESLDFDGTPSVERLIEEAESHLLEKSVIQARFQQ